MAVYADVLKLSKVGAPQHAYAYVAPGWRSLLQSDRRKYAYALKGVCCGVRLRLCFAPAPHVLPKASRPDLVGHKNRPALTSRLEIGMTAEKSGWVFD